MVSSISKTWGCLRSSKCEIFHRWSKWGWWKRTNSSCTPVPVPTSLHLKSIERLADAEAKESRPLDKSVGSARVGPGFSSIPKLNRKAGLGNFYFPKCLEKPGKSGNICWNKSETTFILYDMGQGIFSENLPLAKCWQILCLDVQPTYLVYISGWLNPQINHMISI